jgi:hypothetical protein
MNKPRTRRDLEAAVIKKAIVDEDFRRKLLSDPRSAIDAVLAEEAPGSKLPADLQLMTVEEPANGFYLVLPPWRGELSEAELEHAAGGIDDIDGGTTIKPISIRPTLD